ncbi:hypothetical protein N7481_006562 [Penicillium waksmanii]|uniref:uncharacterized protein n=1 Tax=Penicillium waksmanii TaxID=69791 RepID=UPI002548E02C|nr:uncharacterized protein N7481_006562 [Penicillium waksmanii]KAJ5984463.1 hypothetical protein N7481_006562 [Penicillium waksmanii]
MLDLQSSRPLSTQTCPNRTLADIKKNVDEIRKFYPYNDNVSLAQQNFDAVIEFLQGALQEKKNWTQRLVTQLLEANSTNQMLTEQLEAQLRNQKPQDGWNDKAETSRMLIAIVDEERVRSLDLMRELARKEEEMEEA